MSVCPELRLAFVFDPRCIILANTAQRHRWTRSLLFHLCLNLLTAKHVFVIDPGAVKHTEDKLDISCWCFKHFNLFICYSGCKSCKRRSYYQPAPLYYLLTSVVLWALISSSKPHVSTTHQTFSLLTMLEWELNNLSILHEKTGS